MTEHQLEWTAARAILGHREQRATTLLSANEAWSEPSLGEGIREQVEHLLLRVWISGRRLCANEVLEKIDHFVTSLSKVRN
jgi:hypothetical protein